MKEKDVINVLKAIEDWMSDLNSLHATEKSLDATRKDLANAICELFRRLK